MVDGRARNLEQLRIMTTDGNGRKVLEIFLAIAQQDIEVLNSKMIRSNDWNDVRTYQGGIRALRQLTNLNRSIEPRMDPVTPEDFPS